MLPPDHHRRLGRAPHHREGRHGRGDARGDGEVRLRLHSGRGRRGGGLGRGAPEGERFIFVTGENGKLRPVAIKTGLNAGGRIEVISGDLKEGDNVVIAASEQRPDSQVSKNGPARSPFMPTPTKRQPRGAGSAAKRARAQQNGK